MPIIKELIYRKFTKLLPRLIAMLLVFATIIVFFYALNSFTHFVKIEDSNGIEITAFAPLASEEYILNLNSVAFIEEDDLIYEKSADALSTLYVDRAFEISIKADGSTKEHLTTAKTVQDALSTLGYTYDGEDFANPAFTSAINADTSEITLHRVSYETYEVKEVLPFETQMQYTSLFYQTQSRVLEIQTGQDGYIDATYKDKLIDGEVVETVIVSTNEHIEPVTEILKVYKEQEPISDVAAPDGITVENFVPSSYSTVYQMKATGYYSATGKGSSGLGLYYGTFAVDPTVIPYGTKVYIVGVNNRFVYGWAIATDTGMFIHDNQMQVDLFYETYTESAANGVQQVYVYIP